MSLRQLAIAIEAHARRAGLECYFLGDYHAAYPISESEHMGAYCVWTVQKHDEIAIAKDRSQRWFRSYDRQTLLDNLRALRDGDSIGAAALLKALP